MAKTREEINAVRRLHYQNNKEKVQAWNKAWKERNKERVAAYKAQWAKDNPSDWHSRNRDKVNATSKRYVQRNKAKYAKYAMDYHCRKLHASPSWQNDFFIEEAYLLAKLRTEMLGIEYHVDHIIPLRGKKVCGLHVEGNLQVIPGIINKRKNNKFSEEEFKA